MARRHTVWKWFPGTAELVESVEAEQLRWTIKVPALDGAFESTFQLTLAGADETTLLYRRRTCLGDRSIAPEHSSRRP
jgi:hypothetical protein